MRRFQDSMETPAESFLGLPVATHLATLAADAVVLGVPHGVPYPHQSGSAGSSPAPAAVRRASQRFAAFLDHHDFDFGGRLLPPGFRVVDAGDVPQESADSAAGSTAPATEAVAAILSRGAVPVVIGGDDSIPIPVLRAYEHHGPITVLQIDAHLDFRDEVAGVREGYSSPMRRASEMPWVERILQVGLRGVGSAAESDVAEALAAGNVLITAREVHQLGIETVFDQLPDGAAVFVSLDADGLDPAVMRAVNAPTPGGLTYDECSDLLRGIGTRRRLVGAVLTELAPEVEDGGLSALTAVRLLSTILGSVARAPAAN